MENQHQYIILFDGICNLCNGTVQFIIERDHQKKFRFTSLQSEKGQAFLKKSNLSTENFDSFVYIKNNRYLLKSSAALHVLKDLGGFWSLFFGFILLPRFIRDPVYNIVVKNRYRLFGKRDSCMIPTQELRDRFLE